MRDRIATIGPIAAVAGVLGICCGLPLLLSIGVVGAIAGWSQQRVTGRHSVRSSLDEAAWVVFAALLAAPVGLTTG